MYSMKIVRTYKSAKRPPILQRLLIIVQVISNENIVIQTKYHCLALTPTLIPRVSDIFGDALWKVSRNGLS